MEAYGGRSSVFNKLTIAIAVSVFVLAPCVVEGKVTDVRLPTHLVPLDYKLELVPFITPDNFTIRGYAEIEMNCTESAFNVTLHAADITIENDTVKVMEKDGDNVDIFNYDYDLDREFFIVNLNAGLLAGKTYVIKIHYTAYLKDNLRGFYRSVYKDSNTGEEEYIATTQLQPTDARRVFPCFDEPQIKAKYEISLGRRPDMSSISNMPIASEGVPMEGTSDYVWDKYQQSVKMSTYLVAFVVSKFKFVETTRDNNVRFRIWSKPDSLDQTAYAQEIGPKMLEFFENYYNVKFPLPKQDMIALPNFGGGAMENWGLIVFREDKVLFKEGVSSAIDKGNIAKIVSHELAHQWFGNLVTPSWWTDLWLNEGFATYVQYLGMEAIQPELKRLEQFVVIELQEVLKIDALSSSHPISIPVKHPDEINEIFDSISYKKGASIIRMMDKFLTEDTFRQGLTNYLTDLQFDAAEQDDLWQHLTSQGHKDGRLALDMEVKTIMDTWTLQMGFPVVTVRRNYQRNTATITQERFLIGKSEEKATDSKEYSWWIPLTFAAAGSSFNDTYSENWMKEGEQTKDISGMPDSRTAVVFNVQQTGHYRVNYDKENWILLSQQLLKDHLAIHVINRAQIMDDALNLAKSDLLDYETALGVTGYLSNEVEYVPWDSALTGLSYINKMFTRTPAYGDFKRYMLKLIDPIYTKLGFNARPEDTHLDIKLRKKAVSWACSLGNKDCLNKAKENFGVWMGMVEPDSEKGNPVDVNLKYETYCNAIADGNEEEWDFAWERYQNSKVASEKSTILDALGCTKEVWLLNRYLNMSLTPSSGVRQQDGDKGVGGVAQNLVGRYLAFDFIKLKWKKVTEVYGKATFAFPEIMKKVMADRNTNLELENLKAFEASHSSELGPTERVVKQAIEVGEANVMWMEKNYQNIWKWLKLQN
eukprot:GFUD01078167.1.p1 GENE.GFUD01078167.1~~GFUD01078167.1.p1  ORF type:complete len:930 (-),score=265.24 GFUD01078167.1:347-3136(-)